MDWYNTHIPNPHAAANPFRGASPRQEALPTYGTAKPILPQPLWANHNSAIACYWKVWEIALCNLRNPNEQNGFVSPYIDTAFNGNLFMWDSAFILMFCRYARRAFNFQRTLDNLYCKQHTDGFICREIRESDGSDCFMRFDPPATGPDVMGWSEWEYYINFGDKERLANVFPPLLAYHQWMQRYRTWQDGSYWATGWACGMDNQPRLRVNAGEGAPDNFRPLEWWDNDHMSWIDATLQAVVSAQVLIRMADELDRAADVVDLHREIASLSKVIHTSMWNPTSAFYFDRRDDGSLSDVKTIGAYWALLAGIIPPESLNTFVAHLDNPAEFNRPHRIPTLSADHPAYNPSGEYWQGSVWAPTNYMVLRGLTQNGYHALAYEIGRNHLANVVTVFEDTGTLWENYAPESAACGSISGGDFVGWTGLPPVAVLFEYIFGLRPNVSANTLTWDVRLTDEHGVRQYPFGASGLLDLHCTARASAVVRPVITASTTLPLTLEIVWEGGVEQRELFP